jgi:hypothetical protein
MRLLGDRVDRGHAPDGAALTFRFPRDWLDDWPSVLGATDRLIAGWQPGGG